MCHWALIRATPREQPHQEGNQENEQDRTDSDVHGRVLLFRVTAMYRARGSAKPSPRATSSTKTFKSREGPHTAQPSSFSFLVARGG